MCFYFGLPETSIQITKRYKHPMLSPELFHPSEKFNGFSHPITPIIANDQPELIISSSWVCYHIGALTRNLEKIH